MPEELHWWLGEGAEEGGCEDELSAEPAVGEKNGREWEWEWEWVGEAEEDVAMGEVSVGGEG